MARFLVVLVFFLIIWIRSRKKMDWFQRAEFQEAIAEARRDAGRLFGYGTGNPNALSKSLEGPRNKIGLPAGTIGLARNGNGLRGQSAHLSKDAQVLAGKPGQQVTTDGTGQPVRLAPNDRLATLKNELADVGPDTPVNPIPDPPSVPTQMRKGEQDRRPRQPRQPKKTTDNRPITTGTNQPLAAKVAGPTIPGPTNVATQPAPMATMPTMATTDPTESRLTESRLTGYKQKMESKQANKRPGTHRQYVLAVDGKEHHFRSASAAKKAAPGLLGVSSRKLSPFFKSAKIGDWSKHGKGYIVAAKSGKLD
jgi:hypothetical protein